MDKKKSEKKSPYLRVVPKCEACGGALELEEYDLFFKEEQLMIQTECILCGEPNFLIIELADYIDLEAEFWMAYYKRLPPEGENNEQKT